jgi:chromate reductase, NAD(P)H dehydrogenase (quinone)
MRVLGISGSLRRDSYNAKLLRHAGELFEAEGVEFETYDRLKEIPPYDEDDDVGDGPEAVSQIREAVRAADAVFITTPEYNSSIPGGLKNALDWLSRPLATNAMRNKPVAVVGASAGMFGAVWAQAEVRKVLGAMGARVAEGEVAIGHAMDRFDLHGRLNEPNLEEAVREVARALVAETHPTGLEQIAA